LPGSTSSKDSPFVVGEIIDHVLEQAAYFRATTRSEQERTRQEHFEDIVEALKRGSKVGNKYFQNFVQYGVDEFPFTDFIYRPGGDRRLPTVEEHSSGRKTKQLYQFGALKFSLTMSMMVLPMMKFSPF